MEAPKGALGALIRGMNASGISASLEGEDIVATPQCAWCDEPLDSMGKGVDDLDFPGLRIVVTLGGQDRVAYAKDTPVNGRWWVETGDSSPFSVPAVSGERVSLRIRASYDKGEQDLVRGTLVVPDKMHNMGAPGTLIIPRDQKNVFVYLHAAEVDGERRYIALHSSLGLTS